MGGLTADYNERQERLREDLQKRLRSVKKSKHLTYSDIAIPLGVHWTTVRNWTIRDRLCCRSNKLSKLAAFLNQCDVDNDATNGLFAGPDKSLLVLCRFFSIVQKQIHHKRYFDTYISNFTEEIRNVVSEVTEILHRKEPPSNNPSET